MNVAFVYEKQTQKPGTNPDFIDMNIRHISVGEMVAGWQFDLVVLMFDTQVLEPKVLEWIQECLYCRLGPGGKMVQATPVDLRGTVIDADGGSIGENYQEPGSGHGFFKP